jgi:hypothetical protein
MNLDGLTRAYSLTPLKVSPGALLLDPTNPRLISDSTQERKYTTAQIKSRDVQDYVRERVTSKQHDVTRIIKSIEDMGFIGGLHEMIVKDLGDGGPYLVLEGNRRTAALQHLLARESTLRRDVRDSIREIEVKLFRYRKNPDYTEETVVDVLLGSIHIEGPKEWGALERANYIHRTYMRVWGTRRPFRYDVTTARQTGSSFKLSPKAVHKCLRICRVYEQFKTAELGIAPKHYTLIDLATSTRAVATPYFELDPIECEISDVGIERLVRLILGDRPPIHNPKLFKMFVDVFTDGTQLELTDVETGESSLELVWDIVQRRRQRRAFQDDLEDLKERIKALPVDGFRGTEAEKALINRIRALVDDRLMPLARGGR